VRREVLRFDQPPKTSIGLSLRERCGEQRIEEGKTMSRPSRIANQALRDIILTSWFPLTRREQQVLNLVRRGMGNKEIARMLEVNEWTVRKHLKTGLLKMV
jgi:DNA-binding CsgD family transcriptional regulator